MRISGYLCVQREAVWAGWAGGTGLEAQKTLVLFTIRFEEGRSGSGSPEQEMRCLWRDRAERRSAPHQIQDSVLDRCGRVCKRRVRR